MAVGVHKDDEVIVPTLTFIAAINPVRYIGAHPLFFDSDDSLGINPNDIGKYIDSSCDFKNGELINKITNRIIKAIVVVHVFGNMAHMPELMRIANKFNLKVIEDATEALGTYYREGPYKGQFAGTIGDIGVYSFNGNKIITTGGGGMVVSDNQTYLDKVRYLSTQAKDDPISFIHNEIGYNYRMTNIQAALGLAQLEQLEAFIKSKKDNYDYYNLKLQEIGYQLLGFDKSTRPNYWLYSISIEKNKIKPLELIKELEKSNIEARPIWALNHYQRPYQDDFNYQIKSAVKYHENVVNLPSSSNLSIKQIDQVIDALRLAL
jgi:dTDP-4-amino-4,6-dideoxygalactose transaminase